MKTTKTTIKLIKIEKLKSGDKKYEAIFERNGKTIKRKFGAKGMSDFTIHKDKERREKYINRHKKKEQNLWKTSPMSPATLSRFILWSAPTMSVAVSNYRKKFKL